MCWLIESCEYIVVRRSIISSIGHCTMFLAPALELHVPFLLQRPVCPPAVCKFMLICNMRLFNILLDTANISLIFYIFCYVFQSEKYGRFSNDSGGHFLFYYTIKFIALHN